MVRYRIPIRYLAAYFFAIGTVLRFLGSFNYQISPWITADLLAAFLLLLVIEPWLIRRSHRYTHFYLAIQTGIIIALSLAVPDVDYFNNLFIALTLQAGYAFPPRTSFRWIGGFTSVMVILMFYHFGWDGLPVALIYTAANFAIGSSAFFIRQAEIAREESQQFLTKLQDAHRQLQDYADRVEELAVTAERNRLARDLHDSVTQSLYSLTLFTQAARELTAAGHLEQVEHNLARIADTAGQALKEMRLLVYELRPLVLKDEGLVRALQRRLDTVEGRAGVQARLLVEAEGDIELPAFVEEELYRIAQEALNNALKHAHATSVTVRVAVTPSTSSGDEPSVPSGLPPGSRRLELEVSDDGRGFDLDAAEDKGGLGLVSIRERVNGLGGVLSVSSVPGQGTRVKVDLEMKA